MNLSEYIINDVKPLNNKSKATELQSLFTQLTYSHIPIKNDEGVYLGCISETDAHCFESNLILSECSYVFESFFVREHTVWLDVL